MRGGFGHVQWKDVQDGATTQDANRRILDVMREEMATVSVRNNKVQRKGRDDSP